MKFIFISCVIFTFLSLGYLAYFFMLFSDDDLKLLHLDKKIIKFITCGIFPSLSFIILICEIIYIFIFYKDILMGLLFILSLIITFFGLYWCFSDGFIFIIITIIGIGLSCLLFFNNNIDLQTNKITNSITLYDKSVVREDLCGIVINITSELFSKKEHHALMQYSENDIKDEEFDTNLNCSKFKLIDSQDNRLEITYTEITTCNFLYYHGFTNFKPETTVVEDSTEYILYINPDNILYE